MLFILSNSVIFFVALLIITTVLAGKAGNRVGIPLLLLYLLIGIIAGFFSEIKSYISPHLAQNLGNIALVIILFSGAMSTKYTEIKKVFVPSTVLSTLGVLLTALITGFFIWLIMHKGEYGDYFGIKESLLLAAIMSSTDAASVFGLLREKNLSIRKSTKSILEFESGSNDPMAYMLMIMFLHSITSPETFTIGKTVIFFLKQILIGGIAGYLFSFLIIKIINSINLTNNSLYPVLVLSCVFLLYSGVTFLEGNGFLSVYIAGLMLGKNKIIHKHIIEEFDDALSWLFQIIMFITLGLLVDLKGMAYISISAVIIGMFLILISRPASVLLLLLPFRKIELKDKLFISWIGLRGAVPIIFATYPLLAGMPFSQIFFNIVFFITILSFLLQGISVPYVIKLFKQTEQSQEVDSDFNISFPDSMNSTMVEIELTRENLRAGSKLMNLPLPDKTLVIMIKRKDKYIVPKGETILREGDKLLLIADDSNSLKKAIRILGEKEE